MFAYAFRFNYLDKKIYFALTGINCLELELLPSVLCITKLIVSYKCNRYKSNLLQEVTIVCPDLLQVHSGFILFTVVGFAFS